MKLTERHRAVLVDAALKGVRQIKNRLHDGEGGHCAMGVIHLDMHDGNETEAVLCWDRRGLACGFLNMNNREIERANDKLGWDFLTIARKCGL